MAGAAGPVPNGSAFGAWACLFRPSGGGPGACWLFVIGGWQQSPDFASGLLFSILAGAAGSVPKGSASGLLTVAGAQSGCACSFAIGSSSLRFRLGLLVPFTGATSVPVVRAERVGIGFGRRSNRTRGRNVGHGRRSAIGLGGLRHFERPRLSRLARGRACRHGAFLGGPFIANAFPASGLAAAGLSGSGLLTPTSVLP